MNWHERDITAVHLKDRLDSIERNAHDGIPIADDVSEAYALADELGEMVERLEAENDRLRELVRTIYMCSNIRCNQCEYVHGDTCAFDAEAELRELVVEP